MRLCTHIDCRAGTTRLLIVAALAAGLAGTAAAQSGAGQGKEPGAVGKSGTPFLTSPLLDSKEARVPAGLAPPKGTLGADLSAPRSGAAGAGAGDADAEARAYSAFQLGYYLTAMKLALPEAASGKPAAQTLIAEIFARGLGVPRSMDDAAFWYGQAAKNGDPSAQFNYALMLMQGQYVKKDEAKAQELMTKAADAGIPAAEFNHAQWLVEKDPGEKGTQEALPYYERAADAGIADAQYALSQIYRNSAGIPDAKRKKARYWLERAARAGYDTAQLDLGIWLIDGVDGPVDYARGFEWMKRAAEGGNVMAENRLAHLYRNGIGTKQDRLKAAAWYIVARRAGLQDNKLEDFYQGLTEDEQKEALKGANRLQQQ